MSRYLDPFISALVLAAGSGAAVWATTQDLRPIFAAAIATFASAFIQQLRASPLPRKEWTDEERQKALLAEKSTGEPNVKPVS